MSNFKIAGLIAILALTLSGCTLNFGSKPADDTRTGGLFKSSDFGQTWQQKGLLLRTTGQAQGIFSLDVLSFAVDPTDAKALYFGTLDSGLFYSYDAGESWQLADGTSQMAVASIAIDPAQHCRIYFASKNRIMSSDDCGRAWKQLYADNDQNLLIYNMAIDYYNNKIIYMANSRGDVMKSEDQGVSWRTVIHMANVRFRKVVMSPFDSRILIAISDGNRIFRTIDSGLTWADLKPKMSYFQSMGDFRDLTVSPKDKGLWIAATTNGLYRTVNDGDNWVELKLLTPERNALINSVAISPVDSRKIYYLTDTTFYTTIDGGDNWKSRTLPTPRRGYLLVTDPKIDGIIYLGPKKKV
ncbi:MAG: hypothetical protein WCO55_05350 [Candidatus Falkowbacteria bacterium]